MNHLIKAVFIILMLIPVALNAQQSDSTRLLDADGNPIQGSDGSLNMICTSGCSGQPDSTVTGDITSSANTSCVPSTGCVIAAMSGYGGVGFAVAGTWSAQILVEVSTDGGITYQSITFHSYTTSISAIAITNNMMGTPRIYSGITHVRLRASGYSSGTANVAIVKTAANVNNIGASEFSPGSLPAYYTTQVGGPLSGFPAIGISPYVASTTPVASDYGWVVRNIPSGTQAVSGTVTAAPSTLTLAASGQQAVTASAVALPTNTAKVVCFSNLVAGTQIVYFGVSGVTISTGQEILQGGKECRPVANSNQIYVIAGSAGSTVAFEVYQ